jgi:heme O synthase-like polyprenyltransferase
MKRRRSRGVYWAAASCTITMVMEEDTATMVARAATRAMSTSRLPPGVLGT